MERAARARARISERATTHKLRPFHGRRARLTPGPSMKLVPFLYCSSPMPAPYSAMSSGSHDCTTVSADGQHVTSVLPFATPCGPSETKRGRDTGVERLAGVIGYSELVFRTVRRENLPWWCIGGMYVPSERYCSGTSPTYAPPQPCTMVSLFVRFICTERAEGERVRVSCWESPEGGTRGSLHALLRASPAPPQTRSAATATWPPPVPQARRIRMSRWRRASCCKIYNVDAHERARCGRGADEGAQGCGAAALHQEHSWACWRQCWPPGVASKIVSQTF